MRKKNLWLRVWAFIFLAMLGLALWAIPRLPELERSFLEQQLNRSAQEYFAGSLRIDNVVLNRHLKVRLGFLTGKLQTRQGPVPLEIKSLESLDPLSFFLTRKPVRFVFEGLRPQGSSRLGISGAFIMSVGKASGFEFNANFGSTDLEDLQWLDPKNLGGVTGAMKGSLTFRQTAGQEPELHIDLEAPQPGGNIQARFFDLFLPYLPTAVQKEKVQNIAQTQQLIQYQKASFKADLLKSDRIKILLQIFIPDYNLKLTLNADLRTDQKDAFSQIARILGLIA